MIGRVRLALAAGLLLAGTIAPAQNSEGVEPGQWVSTGRTWDEQRFSPLDKINAGNVDGLGLAWFADLNTDRGQEATPLVLGRVLYNTEPWNIVTAYDAVTGRQLWRYDPQVPLRFGREACCDIVTRGLAAWDGQILVATLDGRLIALDAATGAVKWSVQTTDQTQGYTITGAPRVYNGRVIIGNGGAENGVRGYVSAYDADTGAMLWRWHTVPGNPALGFENEAMERAAATWSGEWWRKGGGGTAWDSFAFDPATGLVYVGTGNGSPWAARYRSPGGGDNLYLASIVALDLATGEYRWHYQTTPGETWDYTATQNMILADLPIGGRTRQVIMQAPKNGFFYVLDRVTGELISAETIAPINWASGVDMATGRPIENPAARFGQIPVMVSPGAGGAHNWNPMAFSPRTGLVYVPVTETYMAYAEAPTYDPASRSLGTAFSGHDDIRREIAAYADANSKGWLAAWDPVTQTERWRVPYAQKGSGGVLVTGGNLVFQGTIGTTFAAYRADTGDKVWEMPVQNVPIAAPITYEVDGVQYIAVNAGWGGGLAHVERGAFSALFLGRPRLLVFRIGGTAQLPPMPAESFAIPELAPPPPLAGTPAQVALGEQLYGANCSLCHGNAARGGVKDLRHMSPATHAAFADIVLNGSRAANGMASFSDRLSGEQTEAIHHYLISRANDDWDAEQGVTQ